MIAFVTEKFSAFSLCFSFHSFQFLGSFQLTMKFHLAIKPLCHYKIFTYCGLGQAPKHTESLSQAIPTVLMETVGCASRRWCTCLKITLLTRETQYKCCIMIMI